MSMLDSPSSVLTTIIEDPGFDKAQVAAAAYLAQVQRPDAGRLSL